MIKCAADAGVDAVKFQTYITENMIAKGNHFYYDIFKNSEISNF